MNYKKTVIVVVLLAGTIISENAVAQGFIAPQPMDPSQPTLEETDYRQVSATLESPLLDELNDYRAEGLAYADGFAGYMFNTAKAKRNVGITMFATGIVTATAGVAIMLVGAAFIAMGEGPSREGNLAMTLVGGGAFLVSIPVVAVGKAMFQKGDSWMERLKKLIDYRHSVTVDVWSRQPVPSK